MLSLIAFSVVYAEVPESAATSALLAMKNRPTQPQTNFARECQSWLLHLCWPLPSLAHSHVHMVLHTHTHLTTATRIMQNQTEFHEKQQRFQHNPEKWQWGKTASNVMPVLKFTLASMRAKSTCVCKKYMCMTKILSLVYDPAWQSTGISECACRPFSSWGLFAVQAMHPQVGNNLVQEQSSTTRKERKRTSLCPGLNTKDILSCSTGSVCGVDGGVLCFVSVQGYRKKNARVGKNKTALKYILFQYANYSSFPLQRLPPPPPHTHTHMQYTRWNSNPVDKMI